MTLKIPEQSLYQKFKEVIMIDEEQDLIEQEGKTYSGKELLSLTNRLASHFHKKGIKKGDTIAVLLPNSIWLIISLFAGFQVGAKITLINPRLSLKEIQFQVNDSEALVLLTNSSFKEIAQELSIQYKLKDFIFTDFVENAKNCSFLFKIIKQETDFLEDKSSFEDIAFLLYSGGTTGVAKGIMLTHKNMISNAYQFNAWVKTIPEDNKGSILSALPLCHSFGLQCGFFAPFFRREKIVILPKFEPISVLKILEKKHITSFYGVPTMYIALLRQNIENYNLSNLKVCVSGGAALPKRVYDEFFERTNIRICEGYGLTECSPVTHINPFSDPKVNSIGQPLKGTEVKLINPDTLDEVSIGEVGELLIKGPQVMRGYWGKSLESINVFTPDGWLRTGDLAKKDKDNYFFLVDRLKDIINSGGLKIYPREVEEVLFKHPGVSIAAVVPKPDEYFGEVGKAFIVAKEGYTLDETELKRYCETQLSKYKIPKEFEFVEELPLSAAGKILKKELIKNKS
ncbi:MAG: AMP-binding protein [Candidatus Heimdallarchaeaceae archaeon]